MSAASVPRLETRTVLALVREGGFAALPGLEQPRRICCAELSRQQRQRLQRLLDALEAEATTPPPGRDRRRFRLTLELPEKGTQWQRELDEGATPTALVGLWKRGVVALDE